MNTFIRCTEPGYSGCAMWTAGKLYRAVRHSEMLWEVTDNLGCIRFVPADKLTFPMGTTRTRHAFGFTEIPMTARFEIPSA